MKLNFHVTMIRLSNLESTKNIRGDLIGLGDGQI